MERIPCIKCTPALWKYIKPYLEEWGYKIYTPTSWLHFPLLVINDRGRFGSCDNYQLSHLDYFNRELVTDVEEFLERAAKLKGFTYKRKDIMKINGVEIKPGMVLIGKDANNRDNILVAFPLQKGIGFATVRSDATSWTTDYTTRIKRLIEIRDLAPDDNIVKGNLLWDESREVVLTMDEIAKKFGYSVEQIKIKK